NFDMAYESTSGILRLLTSDATTIPKGYSWNGSTWAVGVNYPGTLTNQPATIRLVPDPRSNNIGTIIDDNGIVRLSVGMWNGSSFAGALVNKVTTMLNASQPGRNYEGVWPTNTSNFTVIYMGANSQQALNAFSWTGSTWTTVVNIPSAMDSATQN